MQDIYQKSIALHKRKGGKLEVASKVKVESRADLSLVYTPGVAGVCRAIAKNGKLAFEYSLKKNTIAVVSDGSAVLGLGNLGALGAIPVMEGKAILFKEFAGVDAFPICLDTQDTEEIIAAVKLIAPVFGGINLEDISSPRCFEIEERLKKELSIPVMHDDQHGTAVVVLAGLINALRLKKLKPGEAKVVMSGAGAAGVGVAKLIYKYGFKNIISCDSKGIIYKGRQGLNEEKKILAAFTNKKKAKGTLADAFCGADVFIGLSAPGIVSKEMVRAMNPKPIIFAMANPVPEIMPADALAAGAWVVATGRSDFPNQVNNVLAFPGIFRGALDHKVRDITDKMLIKAAEGLARYIKNPSRDKILPNPLDKNVVKVVARAVKRG